MSRLNGKVAVVTAGSSGIGLATAQRFVDEGAHVFIMGRRQSELDKAKALIGDGLSTVAGDVTSGTDLDRLFATVLDKEGGLGAGGGVTGDAHVARDRADQDHRAAIADQRQRLLHREQRCAGVEFEGGIEVLLGALAELFGLHPARTGHQDVR
jgi:NAD(P)-dependent dehydrogenase (short-subunit alcohol dehydrogenase family)